MSVECQVCGHVTEYLGVVETSLPGSQDRSALNACPTCVKEARRWLQARRYGAGKAEKPRPSAESSGPPRGADVEADELWELIDEIEAGGTGITSWEESFLESVKQGAEKYGGFTPKQAAVIRKIHGQRVEGVA